MHKNQRTLRLSTFDPLLHLPLANPDQGCLTMVQVIKCKFSML